MTAEKRHGGASPGDSSCQKRVQVPTAGEAQGKHLIIEITGIFP